MKKIAILMATYNGERFLKQQLDSILSQSYTEWVLYVRDDGSTDQTLDILRKYEELDSRIHYSVSNSIKHGPFINFHNLIHSMYNEDAFDYYVFADQDDIWIDTKLQILVDSFKNEGTPELLYSDMKVIDEENRVCVDSMNADRNIQLHNKYQLFFIHSYIWGCTVAFNYALFKLVPRVDLDSRLAEILSHDNYFAKFALIYGDVTYIDKQLILYRRHSDNVSIFKNSKSNLKDVFSTMLFGVRNIIQLHAKTYSQTLYMIDQARKSNLSTKELEELAESINTGGFIALRTLKKYRVAKNQVLKNIVFKFILFSKIYQQFLIKEDA